MRLEYMQHKEKDDTWDHHHKGKRFSNREPLKEEDGTKDVGFSHDHTGCLQGFRVG